MSFEIRRGFIGLMTSVAETSAPQGALRKADNVVIRKPGAIEPRQATVDHAIGYAKTGHTFLNAALAAGGVLFETIPGWRNNVGTLLQWNPLATGAVTPARLRADAFATARARGNLYLPHANGVLRLSAYNDTSWQPSGHQPGVMSALLGFQVGSGNLANGSKVSYRVVVRTNLANGLVLRTRPTGAVVASNATGIAQSPFLIVYVLGMQENQILELYRSRTFPAAAQIDDEHQLVAEITRPNGGPGGGPVGSAGYYQILFLDTLTDSQRGATIYTAPTQNGIAAANEMPTACACIESYRGFLFFGDVVAPQRFVYSFTFGGDNVLTATGVGGRLRTGDISIGSNQITNISSTTGLQKGQVVYTSFANESGVGYPYITAISGSTVTVSTNATATLVGTNLSFYDAVQINGAWFPALDFGLQHNTSVPNPLTTLATNYIVTPPRPGYTATHVIETYLRNTAPFTIRATHGDEFNPPLPLYDETAVSSTQDSYPNGLAWSKLDEPEHVPPVNFGPVGDRAKRLLVLKATRDSLFIFKEDGIWRLSGINGQWRIDPFDLTTFVVLPSSVQALNNRIYALTNKGLVAVDDEGTEVLSYPIQEEVRKLVDNAIANAAANGGIYSLTGVTGRAATVDDKNGEYILLTGGLTTEIGGQALVYNSITGALTTSSFDAAGALGFAPVSAAYVDTEGEPVFGGFEKIKRLHAQLLTMAESWQLRHDGALQVTVAVAPVNGVVDYTPATALTTSDAFIDGDKVWPITAVNSTTQVVVDMAAGSFILGTRTVRRGMACSVEPHGFASPIVANKHWTHLVATFTALVGAWDVEANYTSALFTERPADQEQSQALVEAARRPRGFAEFFLGALLRDPIPVNFARAFLLRARLSWKMAFGDALLELVGADERDNAPNRNQVLARGP